MRDSWTGAAGVGERALLRLPREVRGGRAEGGRTLRQNERQAQRPGEGKSVGL